MAIFLLKKSYLLKNLEEIDFQDLWEQHGIFTTMWIFDKPAKILFFKNHIKNLIKSLKKYQIKEKFIRKKILKVINKKSKVIISIFAGRLGDSGKDALSVMKKCISISKKFKNVQILWASTREAYSYVSAKKIGCHIITMPPDMIDKIEKFGSSSKNLSIKTVLGFLSDSKKANFKL